MLNRVVSLLENRSHPTLPQRVVRAILFGSVIVGMLSVVLSTFAEMRPYMVTFAVITYVLGAIFTVEFVLRVLDALRRGRHGLRRYLLSFIGIIDLVSILPFMSPYLFGFDHEVVFLVNFARVLLVFKLTRYSKAFNTLGEVLATVRSQLTLSIFIPMVFMIFSAALVYYIENKAQPEAFSNIGDGLWWAVITMTTTGYGDIYPITPLGQVLGGFTALVGVFIIALPTGIVSSAFVNKISSDRRQAEIVNQRKSSYSSDGGRVNTTYLNSIRHRRRIATHELSHKLTRKSKI